VLFYVIGYRKEVVWMNLKRSFPHKGERELKEIRKRFYKCFIQNWVESVKLLSISQKAFSKRFTYDWEAIKQLHGQHPRIQVLLGHCFNWEWCNACASLYQPYLLLPVYLHQSSNAIDQLFLTIRSRFGARPVKAGEMARELLPFRNNRFMLALLADQRPPNPQQAYWINFMNQPAPFIKGPERNARAANIPVVYGSVKRLKRGHYHFSSELFCLEPAATKEGELTLRYARRLQQDIEEMPHTYLWSHKRWKVKWERKYEKLWKDRERMPEES
jgi:Kdo2-lipid IVA lauroyltransferase/acyltransferase